MNTSGRQPRMNKWEGQVETHVLKDAIQKSSDAARSKIFDKARDVRSEHWKTNKGFMARVIPIFEALLKASGEEPYHRIYGQLGYAMKDKSPPDWEQAQNLLTMAIQARNKLGSRGFRNYEFCRAVCAINRDDSDAQTASEYLDIVLSDLRAASGTKWFEHRLEDMEDVKQWLARNHISSGDLKTKS